MVSRRSHGEALKISSQIARTLRNMYWPEMSTIIPEDVFAMLNEANVPFILMGTYGMTGWRDEPRASDDVDILVRTRDRRKAVQAIRASLPSFRVEDCAAVTVFHDPATERSLIEVRRPTQPMFKLAFRQSILVEEGYRIPPKLRVRLGLQVCDDEIANSPLREKVSRRGGLYLDDGV